MMIENYDFLLNRFYIKLDEINQPSKKFTMKYPSVIIKGRRTCFINFDEICKNLNRSLEHVMSFILSEFGCTGSIDSNNRLNLDGYFQSKHLETIFRKYVIDYIKCKTCGTPDTLFIKEDRINFIICNRCKSQRQLQTVKKGFQITTRQTRIQNKNKF